MMANDVPIPDCVVNCPLVQSLELDSMIDRPIENDDINDGDGDDEYSSPRINVDLPGLSSVTPREGRPDLVTERIPVEVETSALTSVVTSSWREAGAGNDDGNDLASSASYSSAATLNAQAGVDFILE